MRILNVDYNLCTKKLLRSDQYFQNIQQRNQDSI